SRLSQPVPTYTPASGMAASVVKRKGLGPSELNAITGSERLRSLLQHLGGFSATNAAFGHDGSSRNVRDFFAFFVRRLNTSSFMAMAQPPERNAPEDRCPPRRQRQFGGCSLRTTRRSC